MTDINFQTSMVHFGQSTHHFFGTQPDRSIENAVKDMDFFARSLNCLRKFWATRSLVGSTSTKCKIALELSRTVVENYVTVCVISGASSESPPA